MTNDSPFVLEELALALRHRLEVIADHELRDRDAAAHLKKLQEASQAIEHAAERLGKNHPPLRHYLDCCSYNKALAWIEDSRVS